MKANRTTLASIHRAAQAEFLQKGFLGASLRNIVKSVGMTTGAFYGYYKSKEELFGALVGEHYDHFLQVFWKAQNAFATLPPEEQPQNLGEISGACMFEMLRYAYDNLPAFKLLLCSAEGTKYAGLVDEMVRIETEATHAYLRVLEELGRPAPAIEPAPGAHPHHRHVPHVF